MPKRFEKSTEVEMGPHGVGCFRGIIYLKGNSVRAIVFSKGLGSTISGDYMFNGL